MTEWYADGLFFSCVKCGACCSGAPGYVWLNRGEGEAIAEFLDISREEFFSTYARRVDERYSLKEQSSGDCIFLQREPAGCAVYGVRPLQCRTWPFWPNILLQKTFWDRTAESCPGMNRGSFHSAEEIRSIVEQAHEQD